MKKIFFSIIILAASTALIVHSLGSNPHDFPETICFDCHEASTDGTYNKITDNITLLCNQCHGDTFNNAYIHPVDIAPSSSITIPVDMPLSSSGNITCNTCHDVHSPYETPLGDRSYFLRRLETGKAFCDTCHGDVVSPTEDHQAALGEAHFLSSYIEIIPGDEIDPMSKNCLTCHDGTYATTVTINAGIWTHSEDAMTSHPIGIDYEEARLKAGRKTDLRPIGQVDPRMLFFNGRVGCGTCHNPYTDEMKYLVKDDYRSQLCFSCHALDG